MSSTFVKCVVMYPIEVFVELKEWEVAEIEEGDHIKINEVQERAKSLADELFPITEDAIIVHCEELEELEETYCS